MKKLLILALLMGVVGCASTPMIHPFLSKQGKFSRVSVGTQSIQNGERIQFDLAVTAVLIAKSRKSVNREPSHEKIEPILQLQDFYISPGTYIVQYICTSHSSRKARLAPLQIAKASNYKLSCSAITGDLIIQSAPNYAIKGTSV